MKLGDVEVARVQSLGRHLVAAGILSSACGGLVAAVLQQEETELLGDFIAWWFHEIYGIVIL